MDGVIVDSEKAKGLSWQKLCEVYGINVDGAKWYRERVGRHGRDLIKEAIESFKIQRDVDELFNEQVGYSKALEREAEPIQGTIELIKSLSVDMMVEGYFRGVVSSNYRDVIHGHLIRAEIEKCFDVIASGVEDVPQDRQKPFPDVYLFAFNKIKKIIGDSIGEFTTKNCLAIEDTSSGIQAAKSAGMHTIGFVNYNSGNQDLSGADFVLDDLRNLKEDMYAYFPN